MRRILASVLCTLALLAVGPGQASATLTNYAFTATTGSVVTPSSWTTLVTGANGTRTRSGYYNAVYAFNLPFTFVLDGTSYSRMSVSTNGLISLGNGNAATTGSNNLNSTSFTYGQFPRIASFWDQHYVTGGANRYCSNRSPKMRWGVAGSAPNRIVVVDWTDIEVASYTAAFSSWQARFYEGSNIIEFFYTDMSSVSCKYGWTYSTSATIGIADASNDFISVTPNYGSATTSTTSANNFISLGNSSQRPPASTLYRFAPCNISLAGDLSQGGTATMSQGDTLMANIGVQRGNTGVFTPFRIDNTMGGCGTRTYSMAIGGANASDFSLNTTVGLVGGGSNVTPSITFTPNGIGVRSATLTVADDNGFNRTFQIAAVGVPRIAWNGSIPQGGTATLADGDTIMRNIFVPRRSYGTFTPITLTNVNSNESATPAAIALTIDSAGGTSAQYSIVGPSTASLSSNQSFTPVIRFDGIGIGPQPARLTVNADGEVRVYTLYATSMAPAIEVSAAGVTVGPSSPMINQLSTCVGNVLTTVPVTVANVGTLPLVVDAVDVYETDTTYQQGTPSAPLLRTARGALTQLHDYVLSDAPGVIPISATPSVPLPFTVEAGATRTLYLTFVGQEPGKRFGRMFVRTNAENIFGVDTNAFDNTTTMPTITEGLFVSDLLGRATGSRLAFNGGADMSLKPIVFADTRVGDTSEATLVITNTGACDLHISRTRFRVSSGDVNDIKLVQGMRTSIFDAATGDYVLAPGLSDTVRLRFVPSRSGTRMATLMIQTNDSTIYHPGIAERGAYYLDLFGRGLAGLDARDLVLDPVAIGSSVSGVAMLENTLTVPVSISSIAFAGDDAAEFSEDAAKPWPARPHVVLPGEKIGLSVRLTPTGVPGVRRTVMTLVTSSGDTVRVPVRGEAGTQSLVVSPTSLFDNLAIAVGQVARQTVLISNTGTLPLRIASIAVNGTDSASYRLGLIPRYDLEPGQTEFLEVTYAPIAIGQTSATLDVIDANGTLHSVLLGGTALKFRHDPDNVPTMAAPVDNGTMESAPAPAPGPTLR
jgi:hypothetical protein